MRKKTVILKRECLKEGCMEIKKGKDWQCYISMYVSTKYVVCNVPLLAFYISQALVQTSCLCITDLHVYFLHFGWKIGLCKLSTKTWLHCTIELS